MNLKADATVVTGINSRLQVAEANYVMKVSATRTDGKKVFAAIGLAATAASDAGESQILFQADKFLFIPNASNINASPVNVLAVGSVDGVTTLMVPAARIGDLTVGTLKIQNEAISSNYLSSISEVLVYSPDYVGEVTTGGAQSLTITSGLQSPLFTFAQGAVESFSNLNVRLVLNTTNARWLDIEVIPYLVNSGGSVIQTGTTAINRTYTIPTRYVSQQFNMAISQIFSGLSAGNYRVRFTVIVRCRGGSDTLEANMLYMGVSARIQAVNRKV